MAKMPTIANTSLLRRVNRSLPALAKQCVLTFDGKQSLDGCAAPADYFAKLIALRLWTDAIQMLAYALPQRQAVWWGCLCVWHASAKDAMGESDKQLMESTGKWVLDPTREIGALAAQLADSESEDTQMRRLASAVDLASAENAGRADVASGLIAAAVLNAAHGSDSSAAEFVALGLRIGNQEIGWSQTGE